MNDANNCVLVQSCTLADIESMINRAVKKAVAEFYEDIQPKEPVYVRRKEAAQIMGVSLPTLDAYARAGLIKPRHVGGRIFYDKDKLKLK